MNENKPWFTYRNILAVLAIIFAIWFVWTFYIIISYFLIAAFISLLGRPIVDFLEKMKIGKFNFPTSLAALTALLSIVVVLFAIVALFVPLIIDQAKIISSIDTSQASAAIEAQLENIDEFIVQFQETDSVPQQSVKQVINDRLKEWISITSVTNIINTILGGLGSIMIGIFSVVFISFFFLRDQKLFYNIIMTLTPTRFEAQAKRIMHSSKLTLTRYAGGIVLQSAIVFILVSLGLWIMGFNYYFLIGFFCAIVNVIPYLGPIIGTLFALLVELTTTLSENPDANIAGITIKVIALIQGVQLLDNYISQPVIFSKRIHAHPLEIFFIVLIFGSLAGIPGMILAVPVYSFLRIIAKEFFSEFKIVKKMTQHIE